MSQAFKPKVLGKFGCRVRPICRPGFEQKVLCVHCKAPVTANCEECMESFCSPCFTAMHCKGNKRRHTLSKLLMCSYCCEQNASKRCVSCVVLTAPILSAERHMSEPKGLYCDGCFAHHHETFSAERLRREHYILTKVKDLYLVKQQLLRPIPTHHRTDPIIQPCEECELRGAAHRCITCDQVTTYCF